MKLSEKIMQNKMRLKIATLAKSRLLKITPKNIHVTVMDIKVRKSKLSRYNSYVVVLRKAFRILSLTAKFSVRCYATLRNGSRLNFIISTTEKITAHIWKWATMCRNKKCSDVLFKRKRGVLVRFMSIRTLQPDLFRFTPHSEITSLLNLETSFQLRIVVFVN